MWKFPTRYDVIVVGAGHAGVEAALASACLGVKTLLLTTNLDHIAKMSCNPAIGGIAKGQIVREIDALGGAMGEIIDKTGIQYRMLNASKGPAVWAPRAQADKELYAKAMRERCEATDNLDLKQELVTGLIIENEKVHGVKTKDGIAYHGHAVIITTGTFLKGKIHIGDATYEGGRAGEPASISLSDDLKKANFRLGRLKTGTPPRVHRRSINLEELTIQKGEASIFFSFEKTNKKRPKELPCYITYTTPKTHDIIRTHIHLSPLFSGKISGIGTRYCPSIEDKVMRFPDKTRHQIFLEPEGLNTCEVYLNGLSTSLPPKVQWQFLRTIPGLERAEICKPGYAIEYDFVESGQIQASLETKTIEGLFFAGQINGTSGYEEAAAQGLIAGINAARKITKKPPLILKREEAYIGVMIDDLVTKGIDEPYRMLTSLAEHRLLLRQDNADLRLTQIGYQMGLISHERWQRVEHKKNIIEREMQRLQSTYTQQGKKGYSLAQILARPEITYADLQKMHLKNVHDLDDDVQFQVQFSIKYAGYIERQLREIAKLNHLDNIRIPQDFPWEKTLGLRNEAKQKLSKNKPENAGQAFRTPGVSPADISVLLVALKTKRANVQ